MSGLLSPSAEMPGLLLLFSLLSLLSFIADVDAPRALLT
jgi:hypothetical protein